MFTSTIIKGAIAAVGLGGALMQCGPATAKTVGPAVCTEAKSNEAMASLAKVGSWQALHRFHSAYARCDDGGPAEDITEFVVHTLAHHWSWLAKLDAESRNDPHFLAFVIRHIDSTADTDDLLEVKRTATSLCPAKLSALCARVKSAATAALK